MANSLRRQFIMALAAAAPVLAGLGAADTVFAQDGTIRLGIVAPMSGPNARYGAFSLRGAQLAAKEINEAGGIDGKKIQVFSADSQGTPVEGVSATRRLISQDKVDFLIGDVSSSVTLAMQPVVEDAGVLLINAASSNPKITYAAGVGGFKWSFRNYPSDENRALVVAQYAAEKRGFTKFAVLSVDSDYGRSAIEFTKKYLPRFKGQILTEDYYKEGEVDFRSVLAKIRDSGAQAIIMYGLADTTPIVARQMIEVGLAGKMPLIGNGEFNTEKTIKSAAKAMEGAVEAAAWLPAYESAKSKAFVAKFTGEYREAPNNHAYVHWETVHLLGKAIQAAKSTDRAQVRDALKGIKYDSAVGEVTFDDHNQARLPMILLEIESGQPVVKGAFYADIDYPR
ncbi:MAG: ABC transporter substrate-binding protein [Bosea sp.]|uniref:ABC transporter substrate-binding protein n=1 Tax=Bosea sp. (in: a-proteobacteria) TaxID=1871050 RepID=UPI0023922045|nr:ABC transporter substrate-binding protein [Bosea sp. (in: a-proteobacteria)]MCP4737387.1 ABC transporter substrate-binding protein [Bosea sp. (in: a-proteobacteria)]